MYVGFPGGIVVKNLPANAEDTRDLDSVFGSRRSPGKGNGYTIRYSCLENSTDRGSLVGYNPWSHKRVRQDWAHTGVCMCSFLRAEDGIPAASWEEKRVDSFQALGFARWWLVECSWLQNRVRVEVWQGWHGPYSGLAIHENSRWDQRISALGRGLEDPVGQS